MSEGKRGFAALEGMPKEIAEQHEAAIKKAWDSDELKEFMNRRGFDMIAYLFAVLGLEKNVVFGLLATGYLLLASKRKS